MEKEILTIPNISCGHCLQAIKTELEAHAGVQNVDGDPEKKRISVHWDAPATLESIRNLLVEINYPAV